MILIILLLVYCIQISCTRLLSSLAHALTANANEIPKTREFSVMLSKVEHKLIHSVNHVYKPV